MYIFSAFNARNTNTHTCKYASTHTHWYIRAMEIGIEERVFKKRKVFKENLKELREVEGWTETWSWFQITGAW